MAKFAYCIYRDRLGQSTRSHKQQLLSRYWLDAEDADLLNETSFSSDQTLFHCVSGERPVAFEDSAVYFGSEAIAQRHMVTSERGYERHDGLASIAIKDDCIIVKNDINVTTNVWYYFDESCAIISNSIVNIVLLSGRFDKNLNAICWMISSGTLGPDHSWDAKVKKLPSQSELILDRTRWTLAVNPCKFQISPKPLSKSESKELLIESIFRSMSYLSEILDGGVAIALSGGYDSRAILHFLRRMYDDEIQTVSWCADSDDLKSQGTDYDIANSLSKIYNTKHSNYVTMMNDQNAEKSINAFIKHGEARIDHYAGYIDAMQTWRNISIDGFKTILRGDMCFGRPTAYNEKMVRSFGGETLDDVSLNDSKICDGLNIDQNFPKYLKRRPDESFSSWRDRFHLQYRLPTVQSALNDLKLGFVEIYNPLLVEEIVRCVSTLPDSMRNDKFLFRDLMEHESSSIDFANKSSLPRITSILQTTQYRELLFDFLLSSEIEAIFPKSLIRECIQLMEYEEKLSDNSFVGKIERRINRKIFIEPFNFVFRSNIECSVLIFRMLVASKMILKLEDIAKEASIVSR